MKNLIAALSALSLSISALTAADSAAATHQSLSADEVSILSEIQSYLSKGVLESFPSFLSKQKQGTFSPVQFLKDDSGKITHVLGIIDCSDFSSYAFFSIGKHWFWRSTQVQLLYLTTDKPISGTLFNDVRYALNGFLNKELDNSFVFIQAKPAENLPPLSRLQEWVVFNEQESHKFHVLLTDDGQGGTHFTIERFDL